MKNTMKNTLKKMCVRAGKFACGTASVSFTGQPKEPKNLKAILTGKR